MITKLLIPWRSRTYSKEFNIQRKLVVPEEIQSPVTVLSGVLAGQKHCPTLADILEKNSFWGLPPVTPATQTDVRSQSLSPIYSMFITVLVLKPFCLSQKVQICSLITPLHFPLISSFSQHRPSTHPVRNLGTQQKAHEYAHLNGLVGHMLAKQVKIIFPSSKIPAFWKTLSTLHDKVLLSVISCKWGVSLWVENCWGTTPALKTRPQDHAFNSILLADPQSLLWFSFCWVICIWSKEALSSLHI